MEGIKELPEDCTDRPHGSAAASSQTQCDATPERCRSLTPKAIKAFGEQFIADTQVVPSNRRRRCSSIKCRTTSGISASSISFCRMRKSSMRDATRWRCCFSNYKQCFAAGQEFTYGLEDIGRYYRAYVDLMAHWDAVLPGQVLRVWHENIVEDFESNVRRILDFLLSISSRRAWNSTGQREASGQRVRSRCANRSTKKASVNGETMSLGSVHCGPLSDPLHRARTRDTRTVANHSSCLKALRADSCACAT